MPTSQPIHRIILDVLAWSDPEDYVDDIFKNRGLIMSKDGLIKKYVLESHKGKKEFKFKYKDKIRVTKLVDSILSKFEDGSLTYPKTTDKKRCTICPLKQECIETKAEKTL